MVRHCIPSISFGNGMLAEETLAASAAKYKFTDFRNAGQDECQARILEGAGALNRLGSLFPA
jgi:hypothetical protein